MTKTRDLNGPSLEALNETKFLIIFLHGWGSNGDDLIQIGYQWHEILNNITFLAPNGPDACPENPLGRQWFDILSNNENNMLDGLEKSYLDLKIYISEHLKKYNLKKDSYFLVGFSQGTMLALHVAMKEQLQGIIGYSGAFLGSLRQEPNIKNDFLLIHGKNDGIVPVERMYKAHDTLKGIAKSIEYKVYDNLEHSINEDGLKEGIQFIKKRAFKI